MARFFEATDRSNGIDMVNVGPINTNCSDSISCINLVIICESPSYEEVKYGFPTIVDTGQKIFENLKDVKMIKSLSEYSYGSCYHLFEENGIYITNLVRYQADKGIKQETTDKDSLIKKWWKKTKEDILEELAGVYELKMQPIDILNLFH